VVLGAKLSVGSTLLRKRADVEKLVSPV
jgi:male germ cell-associated kinase